MDYIIMEDMYESMSSGKVDKYLVQTGDKVKKGQPVAEIIAEVLAGAPCVKLLNFSPDNFGFGRCPNLSPGGGGFATKITWAGPICHPQFPAQAFVPAVIRLPFHLLIAMPCYLS